MAGRPEESQKEAQWRTAGDRIQTLLDATSAGGSAARERAEQLVREVVELYGEGLARIVTLLDDSSSRRPIGRGRLGRQFAAGARAAST